MPLTTSNQAIKAAYRNYAVYHQNPLNVAIHAACVPLILLSIIGLLNVIPSPFPIGYCIPALFMIYYIYACPRLIIAALLLFSVLLGLDQILRSFTSGIYWQINAFLFVSCWALQFLGHRLEGNRPAFVEDRRFLIHGPFLAAILAVGHLFPHMIPSEIKS